jgi:hypothetical protein
MHSPPSGGRTAATGDGPLSGKILTEQELCAA